MDLKNKQRFCKKLTQIIVMAFDFFLMYSVPNIPEFLEPIKIVWILKIIMLYF